MLLDIHQRQKEGDTREIFLLKLGVPPIKSGDFSRQHTKKSTLLLHGCLQIPEIWLQDFMCGAGRGCRGVGGQRRRGVPGALCVKMIYEPGSWGV